MDIDFAIGNVNRAQQMIDRNFGDREIHRFKGLVAGLEFEESA